MILSYCQSVVIWLVVILSIAQFIVALLGYLRWDDINRCDMTFMYQYPAYIKIPMSVEVERTFPSYGLYVYGEGSYAERLRNGVFEGAPVLFIPGNSGSYRQVRSVASVALTKRSQYPKGAAPEFNVFTLDFDEELSGIYGGYLDVQINFTKMAISKIFELYEDKPNKPKQIVLIGHSMGGLVARGLFSTQDFDANTVSMILSLASPHVAPVLSFDSILSEKYQEINEYWRVNLNSSLAHVGLVSIGGGSRDNMVRSDWTTLGHILPDNSDDSPSRSQLYHSLSTALPRVWATADHLCIVWCNQVIRLLTRIIYDCFDYSSRQVSQDPNKRFLAISNHLMSPLAAHSDARKEFDFADWRSVDLLVSARANYTSGLLTPSSAAESVVYKLTTEAGWSDGSLTILSDQDLKFLIFNCTGGDENSNISDVCRSAKPVTELDDPAFILVQLLPGNLHVIKVLNTSFLVGHGQTLILPAVYHSERRSIILSYPGDPPQPRRQSSSLDFAKLPLFGRQFIDIDVPSSPSLYATNISIMNFCSFLQVLQVQLIPKGCLTSESDVIIVMQYLVNDDPSQNLYRRVRYPSNITDSVTLKLQPLYHASKSSFVPPASTSMMLSLYLDARCSSYSLEIKYSLMQGLAQVLRYGLPLIPFQCVLLLIIASITAFVFTKWSVFLSVTLVGYVSFLCLLIVSGWLDVMQNPAVYLDWLTHISLALCSIGVMSCVTILAVILMIAIKAMFTLINSVRKLSEMYVPLEPSNSSSNNNILSFKAAANVALMICLIGCGSHFCGFIPLMLLVIYVLAKINTDRLSVNTSLPLRLCCIDGCLMLLGFNISSGIAWAKGLRHSISLLQDPSQPIACLFTVVLLFPVPRWIHDRSYVLLPICLASVIVGWNCICLDRLAVVILLIICVIIRTRESQRL